MTIYSGFSHEKWWFSIVMFVYQRVNSTPLVSRNAPKNETEIRTAEVRSSEPPGQQEHSGIVEFQCSHLCFHLRERIRNRKGHDRATKLKFMELYKNCIRNRNLISFSSLQLLVPTYPTKNIHKTIGFFITSRPRKIRLQLRQRWPQT